MRGEILPRGPAYGVCMAPAFSPVPRPWHHLIMVRLTSDMTDDGLGPYFRWMKGSPSVI